MLILIFMGNLVLIKEKNLEIKKNKSMEKSKFAFNVYVEFS